MTPLSQEELERLIALGESDRVEFKESWSGSAPEKGREAVCAFANDLPGHAACGLLIVGLRDDGTPSGLRVDDKLLLALADIKTDGNILPQPSIAVERRLLRGLDVAVVSVEPSDSPPVRCKGRIQVRIGPRRGTANSQDERILSERRRHRDRPFDARPVSSAQLDDLDRRPFEDDYLAGAFAADVLAANERPYEQRLASLKMVSAADTPVPTVLGLLVLGMRTRDFLPGAYVQFLRISGRQLSDPVSDEQLIDGTITEVLRRTHDKLLAHNRTSVVVTATQREHRSPDYPMAALDQLVANAVMHRSYEGTNAPVRVHWFDDRIEIWSPGGPFGAVTRVTFGQPGVTDYRNPNLAEALRVLGFVQKFGIGISTARRALDEAGHPPLEHLVEDHYVCEVVRARTP